MKNRFVKSILVVLLLMMVTFTFSACASVSVAVINNEDDTIDELVTVTLDTQAVLSAGENIMELKTYIQENSQDHAEAMKNKLNDKIAMDKILATEETKKILDEYIDGIEVVESKWQNNTYVIGIRFKNIDVYRYYYNISENAKVEMQTEEHFWHDKVYYYASTMYVKHHDLYDRVLADYVQDYPNLVTAENPELLYCYKTDLRRQHSDADYITWQDGAYYHTWKVDPNNLNEPIMLYYNIANPESYILVALCLTAGVTIILGIIATIIHFKKKKTEN